MSVQMPLALKCEQVINEEGYPISCEQGSLEDLAKFDGDLVITMSDFAEELAKEGKVAHVVSIRNIVDKKEIKGQLDAFLAEKSE